MTSHLGVMILFAACISVVFGVLQRDQPGDQLRVAAKLFAILVVGAYALGWIMYWAYA